MRVQVSLEARGVHKMSQEKQRDDDFFVPTEITPEEAKENKETFFKRLEPFFAPSVLLDIKLAYIMAKHGHRDQFRKELDPTGAKVRYFEHVRRVALVLFDEGKCTRPEMIIACLLHDGIEDTRDLTAEMIEHTFGADVCSIVKILSKAPKEGYIERLHVCKDWRPLLIKACDRLDNLRSLSGPTISSEFKERQIKETREKYVPIFHKMLDYVPTKCRQDAMKLVSMIDEQLFELDPKEEF